MKTAATPARTERGTVSLRRGAVRVDGVNLIEGVDFSLMPGAVTGLIGPNGAGKSTLLKVLACQQALSAGELFLGDQPYSALKYRLFAQRVAYLPQGIPSAPGLTVDELVCLGRYPWHGALGRFSNEDRAAVNAALALTGTGPLAQRFVDSLSGGERQRCWLAMLLAQEASVLLLDEPVSALDARYQIETMELVRRIAQDRKVSILVVLHDVNLAARYCDRITALKAGRVAWEGPADRLMDTRVLEDIYDTPMALLAAPEFGGFVAFARSTRGSDGGGARR